MIFTYDVFLGDSLIIHDKTRVEIMKQLGVSQGQISASVTTGSLMCRKYRVAKCRTIAKHSLASKIDDQKIIDILNAGGTYEQIAEAFSMPEKLRFIKQYCFDRGYTYKNRGHLKICDSPRQYLSGYYQRCGECGFIFSCANPGDYTYKLTNYDDGYKKGKPMYYCSYSCFRKAQKKREEKHKRHTKPIDIDSDFYEH